MTLGQLRRLLSVADDNATVVYGFKNAHSWRGVYAEAAFEPALNVSVQEMRAEVERALTGTFEAYKGGEYTYHWTTAAHLDNWGEYTHHDDWSGVVMSIVATLED